MLLSATSDLPWWHALGDVYLQEAVTQALTHSPQLYLEQDGITEARAQQTEIFAGAFPTVTLDASNTMTPSSTIGFSVGISGSTQDRPPVFFNGSVLATLRYRLDIFGSSYVAYRGIKRTVAARRAQADSVAAQAAMDVASAYLNAVATSHQLRVADAQVASNTRLENLLAQRYSHGDADFLDVLQARTQLAQSRGRVPLIRASMRAAIQRMHALAGLAPTSDTLKIAENLPNAPPLLSMENNEALIEARPDLRAATALHEAARDRMRVQFREAYLPQLSITAQGGMLWRHITTTDTQNIWSTGAVLSVPLTSFGGPNAKVRQLEAQERAAKHRVDGLVLEAERQVSTALMQDVEQQTRLVAQRELLKITRQTFEGSQSRYMAGVGTALQVFTALALFQNAELACIEAERDALLARIAVYHTAGGSWTRGLVR